MLKRVSLFLAIPYSIALIWLSLMNLKAMPEVEVNHGDKIFHFLAYAVLSLLWFFVFYFRKNKPLKNAIFNAVILAILFGIILEVLQGTLTTHRALDIYDAVANSLGAIVMGVVVYLKYKVQVKKT